MKQLKKLVLHKTTPLTVPQMKHITGGYDGGTDLDECVRDYLDGETSGTCCLKLLTGEGKCGFSRKCAEGLATKYGTRWCCDSCYEATWLY